MDVIADSKVHPSEGLSSKGSAKPRVLPVF
jgi:hypothetical protein